MISDTPSPFQLWTQADQEHPTSVPKRRDRYIDLMKQHGYIVDDVGPLKLPCGWQPGERK
jgi:hypothetical protein